MTPQQRNRMNEIFAMSHNHIEYYTALEELKELVQSDRRDHDLALTGAFIMEGIRDNCADIGGFGELLDAWDQGCLELIHEATQYAGLIQDLYDSGCAALNESAPGVFHYEVTNPFGAWFSGWIRDKTNPRSEPPSAETCRAWIRDATNTFFNQGELPL